jgi:small subunit ribosomal protein S15
MPLTKERKQTITEQYGANEKDTGNSKVQVALLTERINELTLHLKTHKKDNHTRYGLLKLVGQRKALLEYLKSNDINEYRELIKKLNIRK